MLTELQQFKELWKDCKKCALCNEGRKQIVFSDGPETARVMICGEGPGAQENETGIPFSGPAGKLMDKIIAVAGLKRQDCYWTNAVRCRPHANRTPKVSEIKTCNPLLVKEIELIRPRLIIVTGLTAAKALLDIKSGIGSVAGSWTRYKNIPAIIIYHPAALLHVQDIDSELAQKYRQSLFKSMLSIKEFLVRPESDQTKVDELKNQQELSWF